MWVWSLYTIPLGSLFTFLFLLPMYCTHTDCDNPFSLNQLQFVTLVKEIAGYSALHSALSPEHIEHLFRNVLSMDNLATLSQGSALKPGIYRFCFAGRVNISYSVCTGRHAQHHPDRVFNEHQTGGMFCDTGIIDHCMFCNEIINTYN